MMLVLSSTTLKLSPRHTSRYEVLATSQPISDRSGSFYPHSHEAACLSGRTQQPAPPTDRALLKTDNIRQTGSAPHLETKTIQQPQKQEHALAQNTRCHAIARPHPCGPQQPRRSLLFQGRPPRPASTPSRSTGLRAPRAT